MGKVLVGCECSGIVSAAFRAKGIEAWSCDILPSEGDTAWHIQADVFSVLDQDWTLAIFHPDCTYLCSSGLHWNKRVAGRQEKTDAALEFVKKLLVAPIEKIALENPIGRINTAIRAPDQYIQPYEYGHDASKKTGLWLKGLPKLMPTSFVEPRLVDGKPRWANQTDSGQNKLGPSPTRWMERARTYQGWADAMANQWGGLING